MDVEKFMIADGWGIDTRPENKTRCQLFEGIVSRLHWLKNHFVTLKVPHIRTAWPGKVQTNSYSPGWAGAFILSVSF